MYDEAIRVITNDGAGDTVSFYADEILSHSLHFKKSIIVNENNMSKPIISYFGDGRNNLSIVFNLVSLEIIAKINQLIDAENILKIYFAYRYNATLHKSMIVVNNNNIKKTTQYSLFGEQESTTYVLNFEEVS